MRRLALVGTAALLLVGCGVRPEGEEGVDVFEDDGQASEALTSGALISLRRNQSNPQWDLLKINPSNGSTGLIGSIPTSILVSDDLSTSAADGAAQRLYLFGRDLSRNWHLFTINTTNAAIVAQPIVARVVDIERNSNGQLVGLCVQGTTKQFCRVDPMTGAIAVLNNNLGNDLGTPRWASAYESTMNRYFTLVGDRLLTIDGTTGQLLGNVENSTSSFDSIRSAAVGQLVGISAFASSFVPMSMNSTSGVIEIIGWITAYIANPDGFVPTHTAIDRLANRLYYIDYDFGTRLYKYNAANITGAGYVNLQGGVTDWHHLHVL